MSIDDNTRNAAVDLIYAKIGITPYSACLRDALNLLYEWAYYDGYEAATEFEGEEK